MEWFKQFVGIQMSSNYQTFDLISRVLDANKQCELIYEIGTYTGSLSIYLGLEGVRHEVPVYTIDIKKQVTAETERIFETLGIHFREMDAFENRELIFKMFTEPCFLLCDGGLKSAEFAMCVPKLSKGSIVAVHDYSTEFVEEHWVHLQHIAEPIMQEEWLKEDVRLALFKIK